MRMRKQLMTVWMLSVVLYMFAAGSGNAAAGDQYTVIADSLNVRSEPNLKAGVIGSLKSGDVVAAVKESQGWYQVKLGAVSGWVAGHYLVKDDGVETASAGKPADDKPQGAEAGAAGAQAPEAAAADEPAKQAGGLVVDGSAYVVADALRVRVGPGLEHKVAGAVYYGAEITVLELGDEWVKVKAADGLTGWVAGQYVSAKAPDKASAGQAGPLTGRIIAIDPGHGGNDPGMIGVKHQTYEKDLNLATSNYLAQELERLGAKVVMTRTKDEEKPELSARVRIAEEAGADAFVSVHYNSSPKKASGTLTFYYSERDDRQLARAIERELADDIGLKSNGISYGNFHVLRENDVPSALVELGFLSNEKDEEIARTEEYQRAAAAAIAEGLTAYLTK